MVVRLSVRLCGLEWQMPSVPRLGVEGLGEQVRGVRLVVCAARAPVWGRLMIHCWSAGVGFPDQGQALLDLHPPLLQKRR